MSMTKYKYDPDEKNNRLQNCTCTLFIWIHFELIKKSRHIYRKLRKKNKKHICLQWWKKLSQWAIPFTIKYNTTHECCMNVKTCLHCSVSSFSSGSLLLCTSQTAFLVKGRHGAARVFFGLLLEHFSKLCAERQACFLAITKKFLFESSQEATRGFPTSTCRLSVLRNLLLVWV